MGSILQPVSSGAMYSSFFFILFLGFAACEDSSSAGEGPQSVVEGPPACPQSWQDATDLGLGCLLYNSTERMDFITASTYCKECYENASLVEILTVEQMDYLRMSLKILEAGSGRRWWWAGAADLGINNDWRWLRSGETVPEDFAWFHGTGGSGSDCMMLTPDTGYSALPQPCD